MSVLLLSVLLGAFMPTNCERHSLTYIYTALSKPVNNPGIHEFTAMGLLDTKMIDYFDSNNQVKVPKQNWMKEKLNDEYWKKGTESRKSKQQWFKVNLDILKERMNETDDEVHVLQWMHGCEADIHPGKEPHFERGIDMYSYDGNNFLYFDDAHGVWVAASEAAKPTKRKWDEVQVLKDYTKGYLEKECLDWLKKFMDYGKQELKNHAPPDVYIFASPTKHAHSVQLTCMATGFYPPDIVLNIRRDGDILKDRVISTGIRPNQDDTYQRRDHITIFRSDTGVYICEVIHAATNVHINKKWDGELPPHIDERGNEPGGTNIGPAAGGAAFGFLVIVGIIIGVVLWRKKQSQNSVNQNCDDAAGVMQDKRNDEERPLVSPPGSDSGSDGSSENVNEKGDKDSHKSSDSGIDAAGVMQDKSNDEERPLVSPPGSDSGSDGSSENVNEKGDKDPHKSSDSGIDAAGVIKNEGRDVTVSLVPPPDNAPCVAHRIDEERPLVPPPSSVSGSDCSSENVNEKGDKDFHKSSDSAIGSTG